MLEDINKIEILNNCVGINLDTAQPCNCTNLDIHEMVHFKFGAFGQPQEVEDNEDCLFIALDHSFDYSEDKDFIFIDHHLIETVCNKHYKSNAELLSENYVYIYNLLSDIFNNFSYSDIYVYMHNDLDGICSGIIFRKLLEDIHNGQLDVNFKSNINLAHILGNYGDIDEDAKFLLNDLFDDSFSVDIFDKKIKSMAKTISRFMKAVRSVFVTDIFYDQPLTPIGKELLDKIKIEDMNILRKLIFSVCNDIRDMNSVNSKLIIVYFNRIMQNNLINDILIKYNEEIETIVKSYMENDSPSIEMTIIFKEDESKTKYKLFIIDTPFDCGRSILWKYRVMVKNILKNKPKISKWYYNVADWSTKKQLGKLTDNCVCYNKCLKKLSFDSSNKSAYNISKDVFNGGGHKIENAQNSLGSAICKNEEVFFDSFVLLDFF